MRYKSGLPHPALFPLRRCQVPSLLRTEPQSGPSGDEPMKLRKGCLVWLKSALIADSNFSRSIGAAHAAANLLCWFTLVPCRVRKPLTLMQVGGGASALPVCPVPPTLKCSLSEGHFSQKERRARWFLFAQKPSNLTVTQYLKISPVFFFLI